MGKGINTWRHLFDICGELNITPINCPADNLDEHIYNTKKKDIWRFMCFCGKEFSPRLSGLIIKHVKSCGCMNGCIKISKYTWQDIFNAAAKFKLTLLNCPTENLATIAHTLKKPNVWQVKCSCDNVFSPLLYSILSGNTTSCGCRSPNVSKYTWYDLINKCSKLELVLLHPIVGIDKQIYNTQDYNEWYFRCYCNKIFSTSLNHIMCDQTTSCGCKRVGQPKHIWKDVSDACVRHNLDFINCPNDLSEKVFDVIKPHQWQIKCVCGSIFGPNLNDVLADKINSCGCIKSQAQKDVYSYIKSLGLSAECNNRVIIGPLELDIYIPEKKIAIEYCGLYWHGEARNKNGAKDKHADKLKLCQKNGIRLITIFENEWLNTIEQTKGYLRSILIGGSNKIMARKCKIIKVSNKNAAEFHNANHIQGEAAGEHIGLYRDDELIALGTFATFNNRNVKYKDNEIIELRRYTIKIDYAVNGGLDRLIKHFVGTNKIKQIVSYSDNRWSEGSIYRKMGFIKTEDVAPTYYYFKNGAVYNKSNFMKSKIKKKNPLVDINKTERQIMKELNYDRIWDCGKIKWVLYL